MIPSLFIKSVTVALKFVSYSYVHSFGRHRPLISSTGMYVMLSFKVA